MLIELTRTLIDIPSVTGDEVAVTRYLTAQLEGLGYQVEQQTVDGERANIFATLQDATPRVVFSTHLDTVPPFLPSREDDDYIYGRGACDAKGIIAAQIAAAEDLRREGINELGLLFIVDEEMGSVGARLANKLLRAGECQYLINGEPTENKLGVGSKGSLRLRLITQGRAAHSAYPEQGESAIEKMIDVLRDVQNADWPRSDFFGETTVNIGTISGGVAPNVIPARAEAFLQIRLVTPSAELKGVLEKAVAGRAEIEYASAAEPVRMVAVEGFESEVMRFTTDIPHLTNWGAPLLLGPGSILDAHTANERVSKRELRESVELYKNLARRLLAQNSDAFINAAKGVQPQ